ncbi:UNVERIFIED_CONTAM: Pro-Pol polyprotein [Sesamum latifolium]|uniref:Pro-Pol polyprotein n=1 Tax=Sesamum latifolium TaxID=2727402 RepID=A0AAW2VIW3_9LAMI
MVQSATCWTHRKLPRISISLLDQFASSRKLRKTELSLFAVRQKDNEPLKEYLQRFNAAALEPVSKFDALLARAEKYINMEDAQAAKRESRGEKWKEVKEEAPSKKPRINTRDKKPHFQRVNAVYTPLTVPMTQAFMAVEEKGLLTRPRSWRDTPSAPNLTNYAVSTMTTGHRTLSKKRGDKAKEIRATSPERSPKEGARQASGSKGDNNDILRKGVIHMITGGPSGGDSHHARKSQIREAYDMSLKEVIEVEAMEDTPLIQFGRAERSGPRTSHNDALVITAVLANYEVGRIFIDSGSSADILFGEAYDQMQLGDVSLEKVNTSLYGFAGEVVHPRGMISLPLTMGAGTTRKTCMLKFLVVDVPSAYNVILGRLTLTPFQAVISIYHLKIKFPNPGKVGKVQGDHLQSRKCYIEAVRKAQKRNPDEDHQGVPPSKKGKETVVEGAPKEMETPAKVKLAEELLNIEVIPGSPDKTTRIGSHLGGKTKEEIILCLRHNADIFAWAPQDLEGINPKVITHHLNIDPGIKPVKQKKRHFGLEKDKVIQAEVDKLMTAGHIEEIQFPEWLSNVVLVPKPGGKWRMCIDFRDLNKVCPKDFYPLPRIDQLVDSTYGCEFLSMMDASQGYHQIMLAPEDRKKVSFITSSGTFCYVACHSD